MKWDAGRYNSSFKVITDSGQSLVDLLDPRPGERILDLGCGTGELTAEIAARGADVAGIDSSADMIERGRERFPDLDLRVAAAETFEVDMPLDAVFSNATLHWVTHADDALGAIERALRPGGRLVVDMGAAGNVTAVRAAVDAARAARDLPPARHPWYFPTPAEQATRLENAGLWPRLIRWFPRPTRIGDGPEAVAEWVAVFGPSLVADVPAADRPALLAHAAEVGREQLCRADGWYADYVRLHFVAEKPAECRQLAPQNGQNYDQLPALGESPG